jgi:hypothetical protein
MTRHELITFINRLPDNMAITLVAAGPAPECQAASASTYASDDDLWNLAQAVKNLNDRLTAYYADKH